MHALLADLGFRWKTVTCEKVHVYDFREVIRYMLLPHTKYLSVPSCLSMKTGEAPLICRGCGEVQFPHMGRNTALRFGIVLPVHGLLNFFTFLLQVISSPSQYCFWDVQYVIDPFGSTRCRLTSASHPQRRSALITSFAQSNTPTHPIVPVTRARVANSLPLRY